MHMNELLNHELEHVAAEFGTRRLNILETGCIRNDGEQYRINDGWSTWTLAKWVAENGGTSTSIDLDISKAHGVLSRHGLFSGGTLPDPGAEGAVASGGVTLDQGYSVNVLARILASGVRQAFELILLDSDNDPNLILHEFMIAKHLVKPGGTILIDDVSLDNDGPDGSKGDAIVPWAEAHGIPSRTVKRTGDGYVTTVVALEM